MKIVRKDYGGGELRWDIANDDNSRVHARLLDGPTLVIYAWGPRGGAQAQGGISLPAEMLNELANEIYRARGASDESGEDTKR